jgi:hypothetical protein
MSRDRLPPPDTGACLLAPYPSSQKGGTLIAEDVLDVATHGRRLCSPDGYRPRACPHCGNDTLHVHEYRHRILLADEQEGITIVVYRCAHEECGATWRILPAFVARRLWRSWRTVERETVEPSPSPARPVVPARTRRRWRERLAMAARPLVQLLAAAGRAALTRVAQAVGLDGTRRDFVVAFAQATTPASGARLAAPAALLHRLCLGVRLM